MWNYFTLSSFKADIGIGQKSTLFPILLALHIASLFYISEKRKKKPLISILISILSFVDNSLFVSEEKSYKKSNTIFYCSYSIISSLFNQFSLVIEYNKLEVFYFSRLKKNTNLPLLDLRSIGSTILRPKDIWQYLGFFFDKKLSF